ncbi:MAG: 50S ribosomal protein L19 [bacterium]
MTKQDTKDNKEEKEPKNGLLPLQDKVAEIRPGQQVRVHQRIQEGDKERVQVFEGIIIKCHGGTDSSASITVRKIGAGQIGVEKIFPLHLPAISKIEIVGQARVRRANLAYTRNPRGKALKIRPIKKDN